MAGKHQNVYHGFGYGGHGVPQASMMGSMLADKIQGIDNPWVDTLSRRHYNWPPEPLRWAGFKGLNMLLGKLDARTDHQIRALQAGRK